jgi:NAD(P)-dependent dehydrogenase (short-subunit alcohol dehydrogenase family)
MELSGAVCLVTGAGSGLGTVIARRLACARASVVVVDRHLVAAREVVHDLQASGASALALEGDVCDDSAVVRVVREAHVWGGRLDALVNNAGGWSDDPDNFPESPVAAWSRVLDLNLRAPMLFIASCLPYFRGSGGGAVVNIASSAGVESSTYASPEYAAAKAGLIRLTTSLGLIEDTAVRVNCVVPGWIGLPRAHRERAALSDADKAALPALVPPGLIADKVHELIANDHLAGCVSMLLDGSHETALRPIPT